MTTTYRETMSPKVSGEDIRVSTTDMAHQDFHQHFYAPSVPLDGATSREVEVQAFRPSVSGGGISQDIVVALCIMGPDGRAEVMLSKTEARDVAMALLRSCDTVGRLEVERYLENHPPYVRS